MAKRADELTRFKKGISGNPLGGQLHNPELRAVRKLAKSEIAEIGTLILEHNIDELEKMRKDKRQSVFRHMMAALAVRVIKSGDPSAFNALLDRVAGKVTDKIEFTGKGGGPVRALVGAMSPEERMEELQKLRKRREIAGGS